MDEAASANPQPEAGSGPGELARRIHAGDRRAENDFVRQFTPGLLTLLRVRCSDRELCRDLVQDTLATVLIRLRREPLDEPEAVAGFLRGTALNLLANALRRSEHRLTRSDEDWIAQVADESSGPYETLESEDMVSVVRELIADLKVERDRELLWRHYVHDEPKERLCAAFDLAPEHFDRVLHRARARLRELLQARLGVDARR